MIDNWKRLNARPTLKRYDVALVGTGRLVYTNVLLILSESLAARTELSKRAALVLALTVLINQSWLLMCCLLLEQRWFKNVSNIFQYCDNDCNKVIRRYHLSILLQRCRKPGNNIELVERWQIPLSRPKGEVNFEY